MPDKDSLIKLYHRLYESYGPQHWWPADSEFEVMVGAILTQNTAWTNVEKALAQLRADGRLQLSSMLLLKPDRLAALIRPSGYYNVKATRLLNLCRWLDESGGINELQQRNTIDIRRSLLQVNGVGPETADDILLYALHRPVFVIDNYTRRLLAKLSIICGDESYEELRSIMESSLPGNVELFKEYHALIVHHAKQKCENVSGVEQSCKHCHVESL